MNREQKERKREKKDLVIIYLLYPRIETRQEGEAKPKTIPPPARVGPAAAAQPYWFIYFLNFFGDLIHPHHLHQK